ncbi:MAG: type IV pilus secretin PilQ [Acidobacteria bacterium]|nr:type IV pilus secretin PilQ [Acidobacteriota bacterium]
MYRYTLLLAICAAMTLGGKAPLAAGAGTDAATLKKIASRIEGRSGVISIEASDPVAYVASQPNPRQFVVELRDVVAIGFADNFKTDPRHPFTAVDVETSYAADGARVARVRMSLDQPLRPRVRSSRNVIFVEAERATDARTLSATPAATPLALETRDAAALRGEAAQRSAAVLQAPLMRAAAAQAPPAATPLAPATAQTPGDAQQPAAAPAAPRFSGTPVSLDFQGADLRAVLRTFAEISSLNVVIDPAVQGTVDVALRDVPWDQALDIILRANRLGYSVDGTVVRIAPLTVLADEEAQRQKLAEAQALAGELSTVTRTLSYARAEQVQPLLTATVLSQRGSITTDTRTNTLIITDLADRLRRATDLLVRLDQPEPQVEIEARIVQTTRDFARRLGVQWGFTGRAAPELGNTLPLAFPNSAAIGGRTGAATGAASGTSNAVNLGVGGASSAAGLALGAINGALNLDVAISALESQGNLRVLSTPRVATQNNIAAEIIQGAEIPIQTVANNTVTVTYRDAALSLRVTPQITSSQTVIMDIIVANSSPNFSRVVNGNPQIDTQRATTKVLVSDGETTVIGGVYISREANAQDRTPAMYRLPLLGWLFKRDIVEDNSAELLIFITPRIVRL